MLERPQERTVKDFRGVDYIEISLRADGAGLRVRRVLQGRLAPPLRSKSLQLDAHRIRFDDGWTQGPARDWRPATVAPSAVPFRRWMTVPVGATLARYRPSRP